MRWIFGIFLTLASSVSLAEGGTVFEVAQASSQRGIEAAIKRFPNLGACTAGSAESKRRQNTFTAHSEPDLWVCFYHLFNENRSEQALRDWLASNSITLNSSDLNVGKTSLRYLGFSCSKDDNNCPFEWRKTKRIFFVPDLRYSFYVSYITNNNYLQKLNIGYNVK